MKTDPRIDAYIEKAAPFAQLILRHIRSLAHRALPEGEEGVKWGMPHFLLGGKNVAGMSAFKAHCALIVHGEGSTAAAEKSDAGLGGYGKIASLEDMPADEEIVAAIARTAERIREVGSATKGTAPKVSKPEIPVPEDFAAALADAPAAQATFDGLAPSHRREYLQWIVEAKRAETREKRILQAVEWLGEGKRRNWKYENC